MAITENHKKIISQFWIDVLQGNIHFHTAGPFIESLSRTNRHLIRNKLKTTNPEWPTMFAKSLSESINSTTTEFVLTNDSSLSAPLKTAALSSGIPIGLFPRNTYIKLSVSNEHIRIESNPPIKQIKSTPN